MTEDYRLRIVQMFESGMMDDAIQSLRTHCDTNRNDIQAFYLLSILLFKSSRFQETISIAKDLLSSGVVSPIIYSILVHSFRVTDSDECIRAGVKSIELFPDSAECYHELGLSYVASASFDEAVSCFRSACNLIPENCDYRLNYAIALISLKRYHEARVELSVISPTYEMRGEVYYYTGLCMGYEGDFRSAYQVLEKARLLGFPSETLDATIAKLRFRETGSTPELLEYMREGFSNGIREQEYLELYGEVLYQLQYFSELVQFTTSLNHTERNSVRLENLVGLGLMELGLFHEAEIHFKNCSNAFPHDPSAWINLALIQEKRGEVSEANLSLHAALSVSPDHSEAIFNLATLKLESNTDEAEVLLKKVLKVNPAHGKAHNHLGIISLKKDKHSEAVSHFELALQYMGESAEVLNNMGLLAYQRRDYIESEKLLKMAVQKSPDNHEIHKNLAFTLLAQGKFSEGWNEYSWRLKELVTDPKFCRQPDLSMIKSGVKLLVTPEQGLGDTIQFLRYFKDLQNLGVTVQFLCPPELQKLFQLTEWSSTVITADEFHGAPPEYDLSLSLLSIPSLFISSVEDIRQTIPYLKADENCVHRFRSRMDSTVLNCGIVWQGNRSHKNDHRRSMTINDLAPLFRLEGIRFHSLQRHSEEGSLEMLSKYHNVLPLPSDVEDISDTAALIMNLDVLVTVDTMVAHLAGALGKKVLLLLPFAPDWRWECAGSSSVWYSGMELFRQAQSSEWRGPVSEASKRLHELVDRHRNTVSGLKIVSETD